MAHLTFADLIARRVPLAASEAAALTLAVARLMDLRRASGQSVRLPDDEWILLSSNGEVSIVEVHGALEGDETASLSALLRRLLRLDERLRAGQHEIVPGGLLIVLARNLGYIHLPATGPAAFRAALERFASADPAVLSGVFWRAASAGRDARPLPPVLVRQSIDARTRNERRQQGASTTDLRRALRDLEQELFELRGRFAAGGARIHRQPVSLRRGAAAAALAVGFVGALAVAALALTGGTADNAVTARPDIVLGPEEQVIRRLVPAATTIRTAADPVVQRRTDGQRTSPARVRRVSSAPAPVTRARASDTPRPSSRKRDPLAAHRGGTRGIPFTMPAR